MTVDLPTDSRGEVKTGEWTPGRTDKELSLGQTAGSTMRRLEKFEYPLRAAPIVAPVSLNYSFSLAFGDRDSTAWKLGLSLGDAFSWLRLKSCSMGGYSRFQTLDSLRSRTSSSYS